MGVQEAYIKEATNSLHIIHPDIDKDKLEEVISHIVKMRFKDPSIIMDNNVTGDHTTITLSRLCNWIDNNKPVVSGNATFYKQPSELLSPTSGMLKSMKIERKNAKADMFKLSPESDEYQMADLNQQNIKVSMNSDYGGSGTPTAAFYTKWSPPATTLMAQSIITTMANFFESFIGDNNKFFSINECFDWMKAAINKKMDIPKWIRIPNREETKNRVKLSFITLCQSDIDIINKFIDNITDEQLIYLFYANNMKELIRRHSKIQEWIHNVMVTLPCYEAAEKEVPEEFKGRFSSVNEYNSWISTEMFLNPYKIPECIKEDMHKIKSVIDQLVYVEYTTPDSINKLNNHKRNTVILVDTDSNIINTDIFIQFILEEIFPGETFNRPRMYNEFILGSMIGSIVSNPVAMLLDYYARCRNINEVDRKELTMKNEFLFRTLFLMKTKKRYAASIVLREGNIMIPFKEEIKGMDFIKAGVDDYVSKKFNDLLCRHILFADIIDLHKLMVEIKDFEKEIYNDIRKGNKKFLKQQQFKTAEGYKSAEKAWSLPVFKGSMVWNELYPDQKINVLDNVRILKTTIKNANDVAKLKYNYPEAYDMVMGKVFLSPNKLIQDAGLRYVCIPQNVPTIPDWLVFIADADLIVSDIIASFRSILDALDIEPISFKTPNGNASLTSCLIAL